MTLEEYERDKWDIIGNDRFQQQWVPEFLLGNGATDNLSVERNVISTTTHMYRLRAVVEKGKKAGVQEGNDRKRL
jgi:hypothetical protein